MRLSARIPALRWCATWLCALGIVVPATQAQSRPQGMGLLAPLEPPSGAPFRPPTAQESALLERLLATAQKEAVADTDLRP